MSHPKESALCFCRNEKGGLVLWLPRYKAALLVENVQNGILIGEGTLVQVTPSEEQDSRDAII